MWLNGSVGRLVSFVDCIWRWGEREHGLTWPSSGWDWWPGRVSGWRIERGRGGGKVGDVTVGKGVG